MAIIVWELESLHEIKDKISKDALSNKIERKVGAVVNGLGLGLGLGLALKA